MVEEPDDEEVLSSSTLGEEKEREERITVELADFLSDMVYKKQGNRQLPVNPTEIWSRYHLL